EIYKRLIESKPCHASPVEHQASPMKYSVGHKGTASVTGEDHWRFTPGITHQDIGGSLWSGNFCGWFQARQLIEGHTCWNYQP
ncbi:MAG TPA: hypothetical protein VFM18_21555, partial [Methanosarcina sp.]|nr:hypothetical protein [Methanosarcina sp.]